MGERSGMSKALDGNRTVRREIEGGEAIGMGVKRGRFALKGKNQSVEWSRGLCHFLPANGYAKDMLAFAFASASFLLLGFNIVIIINQTNQNGEPSWIFGCIIQALATQKESNMFKGLISKMACSACACAFVFAGSAASQTAMPKPDEASIVKGQGAYAMAQLSVLAAIYGSDPSGKASKEAFDNGWAPVSRSYASPQSGWPARGPSLRESIEPLLAQAYAAKAACSSIEGHCQDAAAKKAKGAARVILSSKNPGHALAEAVSKI